MPVGLQSILGWAALIGGIYAGYDLVFGMKAWRTAIIGVVARAWVCVVLAIVGVDQVFFTQNAVLYLGYLLGLPLLAVQIGFVVTLLAAGYVWSSG